MTKILDITFMAYFLISILNITIDDKRKWAIFLTGLIIFETFINLRLGIANPLGMALMILIPAIAYSYFLDLKFNKVFIFYILGMIVVVISELITIVLISMIFKTNPSVILEINIYRIIGIIFSKTLFYIISKQLIKEIIHINIKEYNINQFILIGSFNIIILIMIINFYMNMEIESEFANFNLISMGIVSIVFSWLIYRLTRRIIHQNQQEIILQMREDELQKSDFYVKNMNDILQAIKLQEHDLNNYLSTLYGLIYLEKHEESKRYITEVNDRVISLTNIIDTGHPVITSLVSIKKNKAIKENIEMRLDIDIPEDLPVDYVDLSIVIGNLLDNAIEACQAVEETIDRKIELSIYTDENHLIIEANNSKDESIKLDTKSIIRKFTTKSESENHGYGLENIQCIVEEYSGTMHMEDLGSEFSLYISLLMEEYNQELDVIPI